MSNTTTLKTEYKDRIVASLMTEFGYKSTMQVPVLKKIVINQGLGLAVADKKIIETAVNEISTITGQKAVAGQIVLGAVNDHRTLFCQGGSDGVGASVVLMPKRARAQ